MQLEIVGIPRGGQCEGKGVGQRLHAVRIGRSQVAIAIAITVRLSSACLLMRFERDDKERNGASESLTGVSGFSISRLSNIATIKSASQPARPARTTDEFNPLLSNGNRFETGTPRLRCRRGGLIAIAGSFH